MCWQLVFALTTAIVSAWAFDVAWARGIQRAITALPDQGRITAGTLEWPDSKAQILHQGPFIAIVVDPKVLRETASPRISRFPWSPIDSPSGPSSVGPPSPIRSVSASH